MSIEPRIDPFSKKPFMPKRRNQRFATKENRTSFQTMKRLGISKSKLQELRDNGEVEFSQRPGGRIIQYSKQSILEYLEKNRKNRFNYGKNK